MQKYIVYLYLQIALHVSGGISTHHQELYHCIYSNGVNNARYCRYSDMSS